MDRTCPTCGTPLKPMQPCRSCWMAKVAAPPTPRTRPRGRGQGRPVIVGLDLRAWTTQLAQLPVFGGADSRVHLHPPSLHVRRASAPPRRRLAFACYTRHLIHLTDYPGLTRAGALETLLHELVHLSSIDLRKHDARFKRTLCRAAWEGFGVDASSALRGATWKLDQAIVQRLAQRDWPARPPAPH